MFGNIVPLTTVGGAQVLPTNTVGNNDLVIIQDTTTASTQAELINQLQNHITENQQILIITDDQGQDQCKFHFYSSFVILFI
jgi:orotate phosphoribosyltransferase-like protein